MSGLNKARGGLRVRRSSSRRLQTRTAAQKTNDRNGRGSKKSKEAVIPGQDIERKFLRVRELYDTAPIGMLTLDSTGRVVDANLTAAALLGLARPKLLKRRLGGFVRRAAHKTWSAHLKSLLCTKPRAGTLRGRTGCELEMKRADGSPFQGRLESVRLPKSAALDGASNGHDLIETALLDITEQHHAKTCLQESEEQLRLMLELSSDAVFWADAETGILLRCNRRAEQLTGRSRRELIGMHQSKLHPADRDYQSVFRKAASLPQATDVEAEVLTRSGKRTPVAINCSVVKIGQKKIIQGIFRDITDRKQAERALQAERDRAQQYLDVAGVMLAGLAPDGTVVLINQRGCELLGYSREELLGRDWFELVVPDSERAERVASFKRVMKGDPQALAYRENTVRTRTGEIRQISWYHAVVRDAAGKIISSLSSGEDVTERRKAEEALSKSEEFSRGIVESSRDCIKVLDLEGRILSMSKGGAELFELDEVTSVLKEPWLSFYGPQDQQAAAAALDTARRGGVGQMVGSCPTAKGTPKWWAVTVSPIRDSAGKVSSLLVVSRDITEQRQADEKVATASEQRRLVLEATGMGAWDYRFDTGEVIWDDRCREQWGVRQDGPMDYQQALSCIHPEDREHVGAAISRALSGTDGGYYNEEFKVVWPDGSVHWIASYGQVYFQGEGPERRPIRFIGASLDINDRKRLAEASEFLSRCGYEASSPDFFKALARFLAQSLEVDYVCIDRLVGDRMTAQTVAVYVDGQFEDNVTYTLKETPCGELVERTFCCFPEGVCRQFPNDEVLHQLRAESYVGTTLRSIEGRTIGLIALIARKPLSNPSLAESVLRTVAERAAGELQRAEAEENLRLAHSQLEKRVRERTAELQELNEQLRSEVEVRRRTEQELVQAQLSYRTVADFTYDWEYWQSPEGFFRYCSPSCERVTGYSAQEFINNPGLLERVIHPDDLLFWQEHLQESFSAGQPGIMQFRIVRKDGSVRWIEHACQPARGDDGSFIGVRASNRDITDRKEQELQAQVLREELSHVTRVTTVGQLAASLAHELNQPLTAIRCNAETALQLTGSCPPDLREVQDTLADIVHDSERAGGVIKRLRALFKKTDRERSLIQFNQLIQETLDLLRSEIVLKGTTLQVHLDPGLPSVSGNRIELQQVVLNLMSNAMEAMMECHPGQRQLQIATCLHEEKHIVVAFRDSGPGIRVQPISRLFEPFFTTKENGMGMGLAISESIIESHGGTLRAVNNSHRGATFEILLPVAQEELS